MESFDMGDIEPISFKFEHDFNVNQNRCDFVQAQTSAESPVWGIDRTKLPSKESIGELLGGQKTPKKAIAKKSNKTESAKAKSIKKTDQKASKEAERTLSVSDKDITELYRQVLLELRELSSENQITIEKLLKEFQNIPQVKEEVTDITEDEDGLTIISSEGTDLEKGITRSLSTRKTDKDGNLKSWERKIEYTDGRVEIFFFAEDENHDKTILAEVFGKKALQKDENGQEYWTINTISRDRNSGHYTISDSNAYDEAEFSGGWDTYDSVGNPTGRCNSYGYGGVGRRDYGYNDNNGSFHTTESLLYIADMYEMPLSEFTEATGWYEETAPTIQIQISLTAEEDMAEHGNYRTFETNLGTGEEYIREETMQNANGENITVRVHGYTITDNNGEVVQEYREIYDQNREYLLQTEERGRTAFDGTDKMGNPTTKYRHFIVVNSYNCKAGSALRIPQNTYIEEGIPGEVIRTINTETGEDTVAFGKKGPTYDSELISESLKLS